LQLCCSSVVKLRRRTTSLAAIYARTPRFSGASSE
jgi:hypothetical protein